MTGSGTEWSAYRTNTANKSARCTVPNAAAAMSDSSADCPTDLDEVLRQLAEQNSLLSANEVAGFLRLGRTAVYELIKSGELSTVSVGPQSRTIRVLRSSLEQYLRQRLKAAWKQPQPQQVPAVDVPRTAATATPHGAPRRTARRVAR